MLYSSVANHISIRYKGEIDKVASSSINTGKICFLMREFRPGNRLKTSVSNSPNNSAELIEAVTERYSVKKVFLKTSQNSQ